MTETTGENKVTNLLRKAADIAREEEKQETQEIFLVTADQIANERGLSSPLKNGGRSPLDRSLSFSQSMDTRDRLIGSGKERGILNANGLETSFRPGELDGNNAGPLKEVTATEEDAFALLKQMNVQPLPSTTTMTANSLGINDSDVNALLKMGGVEIPPSDSESGSPGKSKKGGKNHKKGRTTGHLQPFRSKGGRSGYFNRSTTSHTTTKGGGGGGGGGSRYTIRSEESKISYLLNKSDVLSDKIRNSFKSEFEEQLFRSMYVVRSNMPSSSSSSARANKTMSYHTLHNRSARTSISTSRPLTARSYRDDREAIDDDDDDRDGGYRRRHSYHGGSDYDDEDNAFLSPLQKEKWKKLREISDRLSKPIPHSPTRIDIKIDPTLRYSTYDDAKECTFHPNIGNKKQAKREKKQQDSDDEGKKEDPKYSFISRQEAEERIRKEELAYAIGKKDYDAKIDKKICPKCHAKQSYDEVKEKRKLCPNCRVEYSYVNTWQKVSKVFFQKALEYSVKSVENKKKLIQSLDDEFHYTLRKELDPKTKKIIEIKEKRKEKLTKEEEKQFYRRLKEKMIHHQEIMKTLEKEILEEYYPFKPQIANLLKKKNANEEDEGDEFGGFDSDDGENAGNPIKQFLNRYEQDMEFRRARMPTRYLPIRKYRSKQHKGDGGSEDDYDDDEQDENEQPKLKPFRF